LLFIAMREILKWSIVTAGAMAAFFLVVDTAFFGANLIKVADGGYVPLLLAAAVYSVMWIWHRGTQAVGLRLEQESIPVKDFTAEVLSSDIPRVPGAAVFLTRTSRDIPTVLQWHLKHNRALHEQVMVLTVNTASVPWIDEEKHLSVTALAPNFWRAAAVFGFMERPDIPALLTTALGHGCTIDLTDVTYYVGHVSITHREDGKGIPRWLEAIFGALERNSIHVGDVLRLPQDKTVELGRQIAI
jgi:KUP system potassium uptake protein